MESLREGIIKELNSYAQPIGYSDFRERFGESKFVDELCFLITTGDVLIISYDEKETRHPEEVKRINMIASQYEGDAVYSRIDADTVKEVMGWSTKEPETKRARSSMGNREPVLIYRPLLSDWLLFQQKRRSMI